MNKEIFSRAMGELDDKYISEATQYRKKKKRWIPVAAAAACLCLIAGGAAGIWYKNEHPWPVKTTVISPDPEPYASAEIAIVPHWEDMAVYEQFHDIELNGISYSARRGVIPADRLGDSLGSVTARGWDEYADMAGQDANRYIDAEVFAITKINPECAVAVRYEGHDTVYAFVNSYYRPETLGQFIEDLNLPEEISFGTVYYEWCSPSGRRTTIRFDDVDDQIIKNHLLTESGAENVYDESRLHEIPRKVMGISVGIPLLGYQNISLSVQEGGYIKTNILDTGKLFYVGEDKTQAFVDYVTEHCEGYESASGLLEAFKISLPEAGSGDTDQKTSAGSAPSATPAASAAAPSATPNVPE